MHLSVILPNYNSGELLEKTLTSIFESPCVYSLEVLIMDNLSTDRPLEIIQRFPNEQIQFHSEADAGIYDAMNKGIQKAKGKWLIFLGAGDELILDSVNQLPLDSDTFKMIYGEVYLVRSQKNYDGPFDFLKMTDRNICHQAILYHASVFRQFGGFDLRYPIMADYVFNLSAFVAMGHLIHYVPLTISRFLGGGVSETARDPIFHYHKFRIINQIVLKHPSLSGLWKLMRYNVIHSRNFLRARMG